MPFQEDDGKPISEAILAKKMEHNKILKEFCQELRLQAACVITRIV